MKKESLNENLNIHGNKVLIVGNRSYKNLGDELILLGTIKLLMKQKKEIYISAFDIDWLKGFLYNFIDVTKINFLTEIPKGLNSGLNYLMKGKLKERNKYREIDSIIIGGGEILTEENQNSYRYRLLSILPCYFSGSKIYLMGGIQVPKKQINKWLFDLLLKKVEKIYARDNECVSELKRYKSFLSIDRFKKIEFFMDTAWFAFERNKIKKVINKNQKYIVVNLNKNAEHFLDEVIEDMKGYINNDYEVYFVPVSKGKNEEYNDTIYAKILSKKLKIKNINILDREYNFENFLTILKGADIVFTGRLHLFMIAKFLGVNVKVYPYQKKILKMQSVLKNFNI